MTHDNRLDNTLRLNGCRQLFQSFWGKIFTWLINTGLEIRDGKIRQLTFRRHRLTE
ncbi:Uncharacterised protein [Vibrio cholerae]|nr:Uncharacterised protein [Vibrio cholerae]